MLKSIPKRKIFTAAWYRAVLESGPYSAIGALSPDLFAQFKYPVYNNVQVLFRGPACTVPVTDAGVHTIGGVKDPFTGAIILTQPDAGKRPLWMGESIGANTDGIDDELTLDLAVITSPQNWTIGGRVNLTQGASTTYQRIIYVGNSTSNGFGIYVKDSTGAISVLYGLVSFNNFTTSLDFGVETAVHVVNDAGTLSLYIDGVLAQTITESAAAIAPESSTWVGGPDNAFGEFLNAVAISRPLSAGDVQILAGGAP